MDNSIEKLYDNFLQIKNMGWIKSQRSGSTGIGYTFEQLINKDEDSLFIPDYENIEIKTIRKNSLSKIHLFNATPDGDYLFPIKRVLDILGYPDKTDKNYKVLNMDFSASSLTKIGYYKRAKLVVNKVKQKLELYAVDNNNKSLYVNVSWSFDLLKERLNTKLRYLAIITANSKFINGDEYFCYENINFYCLNDFNSFVSLIDNGNIIVTFKIGVFKSGRRVGQIHDRGTCFSINKKDIDKLYSKVRL